MKYKVTLNGRTYEVEVEAGKASSWMSTRPLSPPPPLSLLPLPPLPPWPLPRLLPPPPLPLPWLVRPSPLPCPATS